MIFALSRRSLAVGIGVSVLTACAPSRSLTKLAVFKTPTCACCTAWIDQMRQAGFEAEVTELPSLRSLRTSHGLPDHLASCHTTLVAGYVIEGHVPADDVRRLLAERPQAVGLAVPGMPLGSPGMETPEGKRDRFETFLVLKDGKTRVFASHGSAEDV